MLRHPDRPRRARADLMEHFASIFPSYPMPKPEWRFEHDWQSQANDTNILKAMRCITQKSNLSTMSICRLISARLRRNALRIREEQQQENTL